MFGAVDPVNPASAVESARIWLPAGFRGLTRPLAAALADIKAERPDLLEAGPVVPTIFVLPGSQPRGIERLVEQEVGGPLNVAVVLLDTHAVSGRPRYVSPAPRAVYDRVHALRRGEVDALSAQLPRFGFVDRGAMGLLGVSEGAVAAACHPDPAFSLRIVIAWSMETSYFCEEPQLGGDAQTAFLNLVGYRDDYFGPASDLRAHDRVEGHGARLLLNHRTSKVVILPSEGHRVLEDAPMAIDEIRNFIRWWLNTRNMVKSDGGTVS